MHVSLRVTDNLGMTKLNFLSKTFSLAVTQNIRVSLSCFENVCFPNVSGIAFFENILSGSDKKQRGPLGVEETSGSKVLQFLSNFFYQMAVRITGEAFGVLE